MSIAWSASDANSITLPRSGSPSEPGSRAKMQSLIRSPKNSAFRYGAGKFPPAAG